MSDLAVRISTNRAYKDKHHCSAVQLNEKILKLHPYFHAFPNFRKIIEKPFHKYLNESKLWPHRVLSAKTGKSHPSNQLGITLLNHISKKRCLETEPSLKYSVVFKLQNANMTGYF